jgi:hypothetical protein
VQGGVAAGLMLIGKAGGSQGVARCGFLLFGQPTSIGAHNRAKLTAKVRQRGSAFAAAAHQVGRQCRAGPAPVRKINSKGPPFSMRGVRAIAANPRDGSRLLQFLVKAPYSDPEIGTTRLARARARGTGDMGSVVWRITPDVNVVPVRRPQINSKGTAVLMRGVPVIAANPRDSSRLLGFG